MFLHVTTGPIGVASYGALGHVPPPQPGFKKPGFFLKKSPTQWVLLGFLDKQEKIGKIIQNLSNLKP